MEQGQEQWKEVYEFDTPVVSLLSNDLTAEYLSGLPDPHRQSKCSRDDNLILETHASFQRRGSHENDGPSRTIIARIVDNHSRFQSFQFKITCA